MPHEKINAPDAFRFKSGFSQAVAVAAGAKTLFISGQVGLRPDGSISDDFSEQARQVWDNIEAQLRSAGMGLEHIVHQTTFLSDRKYAQVNTKIRNEVFGDLEPALTVVICEIFNEDWLLEVQAIAAA